VGALITLPSTSPGIVCSWLSSATAALAPSTSARASFFVGLTASRSRKAWPTTQQPTQFTSQVAAMARYGASRAMTSPRSASPSLGEDADNVRIDARAGRVVVGYGDGALALLDATSGAKVGEIALPGHPEAFQVEAGGSRVFVNVPGARQVAVADRDAGRQVATWKLTGQGNFPMALDEVHGRLLVVDRNPPELLVFDTGRGEFVARLPTCGDADDVFLDAKRKRVYVSCGEGFIDIVQQNGGAYDRIARVPTAPGARTALFVPELDRLYLAVRAERSEGASIWVFRPE
jgi:hypothetical protein